MRRNSWLFAMLGLLVVFAACGTGDGDGAGEWVETKLASMDGPCAGQRAFVPRTGTVARTVMVGNSASMRTEMPPVYVAYQVTTDEVFAYFSFGPLLPRQSITTEAAREMLKYAYLSFDLRQPADASGSLTLLSSNDLLDLTHFERFEVVGDELRWRLVRTSPDHYAKRLSIYDDDPTNDPNPRDACVTDDIIGQCHCEFGGPPVTVTIEGTTSLVRR